MNEMFAPNILRPREALRSRPRPRFLVSGVMEFWSTGVLRPVGIAPRFRGVGNAFRAGHRMDVFLVLKPQA
jgi:hypothetical protein